MQLILPQWPGKLSLFLFSFKLPRDLWRGQKQKGLNIMLLCCVCAGYQGTPHSLMSERTWTFPGRSWGAISRSPNSIGKMCLTMVSSWCLVSSPVISSHAFYKVLHVHGTSEFHRNPSKTSLKQKNKIKKFPWSMWDLVWIWNSKKGSKDIFCFLLRLFFWSASSLRRGLENGLKFGSLAPSLKERWHSERLKNKTKKHPFQD